MGTASAFHFTFFSAGFFFLAAADALRDDAARIAEAFFTGMPSFLAIELATFLNPFKHFEFFNNPSPFCPSPFSLSWPPSSSYLEPCPLPGPQPCLP